MNTKNKLNCYVFSNLIISFLSLNLLINNQTTNLTLVNEKGQGSLNKIYEFETVSLNNNISDTNNTTTILVSNKVVQSKNTTTINYIKPSYNSITGSNLVNYAKHYLGLRYVSGGNSLETGTDCSGFTKLIFKEFGISLGRTVNSQMYSGSYVNKSDLKPGDLVFYGYSNYPTHVAIYIGNGLVIHESNPNDGVKISSLNMMVYITARRVIFENVISNQEKENESEIKSENKETIKEENEVLENNKIQDTTDKLINKENNNNDNSNVNVDKEDNNNDNNNNNNDNDNNNINIDKEDNFIQEEVVNNNSSIENDKIIENENEITTDNIEHEEISSSIENNENIIEENNNLSINEIENSNTNLEIVLDE